MFVNLWYTDDATFYNKPIYKGHYPYQSEVTGHLTPREICDIYDDYITHDWMDKINKYHEKYGIDPHPDMLPSFLDYRIGRADHTRGDPMVHPDEFKPDPKYLEFDESWTARYPLLEWGHNWKNLWNQIKDAKEKGITIEGRQLPRKPDSYYIGFAGPEDME